MKIHHIELLSDDLKATEHFYTEILGFVVQEKNTASLSFQIGTTKLTFRQSYQQKPFYHFTFNIPCNQIQEALVFLAKRVALMEAEPNQYIVDFERWNAQSCYFYDNNGNILECIARFDLHNERISTFDNQSFLCISEISLVADDVSLFAETIANKYPIPLFEKAIKQDNFAALGDDNGLILIAQTGRKWYPTPLQAKAFPVKILVDDNFEIAQNDLLSFALIA